MLSMYDNREYVLSALRAGAAGYVLKDATSKEIIAAIRAVAAGASYCSASLTTALATGGSEPPTLTEREREILILVAKGNSNKRIAQQLDVSVRTVETHRLNLRKKLGIETPAGLIRYALQQGWIKV
jgi:DNA-binding NarL/FixJ family response regulator